jgi:sugar lactone lactonase YvrE/thiol-disulfide isomerase/thioredoxin
MVRQDFCMKYPHWPLGLALLLALAALVSRAATTEIPYEGIKLAPEFPADIEWLNTDKPITLKSLKGKIVLLDFWTYCCINCMHVIPDLKKLEAKYARELVVIGVHSAKFDNEKQTDNIRQAILRYEIEHPVVNDKDFVVWRAFNARSWPTLVLINPNGRVIGYLSGEGIYEPFDRIIGETIAHFDAKHEIDRAPLSRKLEQAKSPRSLFAYPGKIAADERSQRIFFSDSNHNRLIIASLDGEILDCIGEGEIGLRDGDFASARFYRPQGLCLDPEKNLLYVADTENHAIRKVDLNRKSVETVAGTGRQARRPNLEGAGREVDLNSPWDLSLIGGTLYIAMAGTHQLWSLDLKSLQAKVYAGSGREDITDGPLLEAALAQPSGITTDGQRLYFADSEASAVRTADLRAGGQVATLIGEGLFKFGDVDGKYPEARLQHCIGVAWHDGFVYVADTYNHKIRRLDPRTKVLTTFIGTGQPGMADGERTAAGLNEPNGLCFARDTMYIADSNNHLIRSCDLKTGRVSTVAFRGLEKLSRKTALPFAGEEIHLDRARISPRAKSLQLGIVLPAGTKLNLAGPSKLSASSANAQILELGKFEAALKGLKVSLPIQAAPGQTTLTLDADLYYCSKANEGLCFFKYARLTLPIEVAADGSAAPTVEYKIERGSR